MPANTSDHLRLETVDEATVVSFVESRLLDPVLLQQIADQLYALVDERGLTRLVINFGNVHAFSTTLVGILLDLEKRASAAKGGLSVCGLRDDLKKAFVILNLEKKLKVCKDEQTALKSI